MDRVPVVFLWCLAALSVVWTTHGLPSLTALVYRGYGPGPANVTLHPGWMMDTSELFVVGVVMVVMSSWSRVGRHTCYLPTVFQEMKVLSNNKSRTPVVMLAPAISAAMAVHTFNGTAIFAACDPKFSHNSTTTPATFIFATVPNPTCSFPFFCILYTHQLCFSYARQFPSSPRGQLPGYVP